jgi:hypothetical protein
MHLFCPLDDAIRQPGGSGGVGGEGAVDCPVDQRVEEFQLAAVLQHLQRLERISSPQ